MNSLLLTSSSKSGSQLLASLVSAKMFFEAVFFAFISGLHQNQNQTTRQGLCNKQNILKSH